MESKDVEEEVRTKAGFYLSASGLMAPARMFFDKAAPRRGVVH
jgi:hypothetical protein